MKENLLGQKFNKLTVIDEAPANPNLKHRDARWICLCDCGNQKIIRASALKSGDTKACGCLHYKGYKELSLTYFARLESAAKRRGHEFKISIKQIWELYEKQKRKCALSGTPIIIDKHFGKRTGKQTASLDRINSDLGYINENIQWVHKDVNIMKMDMPQDKFLEWTKMIAKNNS